MKSFRPSSFTALFVISLFLSLVSRLEAADVLFNFESQPLSNIVHSFSMTSNGLTASFLDTGFDSQSADFTSYGVPASWGNRHFVPAVFENGHQIVNFSQPVTFASVEFGDFGQDDDLVHLRAWSGPGATGSILDVDDVPYAMVLTLPGDVGLASVSSPMSFLSIELWEDGASGDNDFTIDNLRITAIPEPSTYLLLAIGAVAVSCRRRHCALDSLGRVAA